MIGGGAQLFERREMFESLKKKEHGGTGCSNILCVCIHSVAASPMDPRAGLALHGRWKPHRGRGERKCGNESLGVIK
jgi:hypothetical protein